MPVPIDRSATLRNAEKLLRQGKLDAAIAEYLRVVEDQPRDWNTANLLGDLYVRAGQVDRGCDHFTRIADSLNEEGFLPKAAALYKKILKLKPDHEHALIQSAEIAASQGLLADARGYLNSVIDRRQARGDKRGVAQMRIRLGSLDPADFDARLQAAQARTEIGDTAGALRDLKDIAQELGEADRQADAVEALRLASGLAPDDEEVRERLLQAFLATGDFVQARGCAATAPQLKTVAAALEGAGHPYEALEVLRDASRLEPDDMELRAYLARAFVARGNIQIAAEYLTVEIAGDDPKLLMTVAEIRLCSGETEEGLAILKRLIDEDPGRRDEVAMLAWNVAERAPDAAFAAVSLAADLAIAQGDFGSAAAALQEFVTRVPTHVAGLLRLVEICVDGGLEASMYAAQAQLADAYLASGAAAEARVIAEDLVAREPWERSHIDRFRRSLELLGESDPDAVIADRLSGQLPFTSTDTSFDFSDLPPYEEPAAAPRAEPVRPAAPTAPERRHQEPIETPLPGPPVAPPPEAKPVYRQRPRSSGDSGHFELSMNAIDLSSILGEFEEAPASTPPDAAAPPAARDAGQEHAEIDLNNALDGLDAGSPPLPPARGAAPAPVEAQDLDGVFTQLREDTHSLAHKADEQYRRGLALRRAGRVEDAIRALQSASQYPGLRFAAASLAGRLHRERQRVPQAIEWLERAAQAPPPSPDDGHQLLYQLAELLEGQGEVARALAILLELQADAGAYRDVAARIGRLTKAQARG